MKRLLLCLSQHLKRNPSDAVRHFVSCFVAAVAALCYFITVDPSASFWDCPEYITCASRLEVGHPPGNPVWMLAMRFATIPFPAEWHPLVINLCSAIFSALTAFLLSEIIFNLSMKLFPRLVAGSGRFLSVPIPVALSATAAFAGSLSYALCDSAWFSAVEAEVYAMSTFLSSLSLWLMLRWYDTPSPLSRTRILILIAYVTGLSVGVHQLNLLLFPVFGMAMAFRMRPAGGATLAAWGGIAAGCAAVVLILFGIMNGSILLAERFELFAVNTLQLPYFSGCLIYIALLTASVVAAVCATQRRSRPAAALFIFCEMFLSGVFLFSDFIALSAIAALAVAASILFLPRRAIALFNTAAWMVGFILLGFSSFALILIRGHAAPPMNEAAPSDIFALHSYIARDQYGSTPLLYGATPYSKPLLIENPLPGKTVPDYSQYALKMVKPLYVPFSPSPRLESRSRMMTADDSASNRDVAGKAHGYLLADYAYRRITTPELDMFLPRITSSTPDHIESYADWAGMTKSSMTEVNVSEVIDSLGNPDTKVGLDGRRTPSSSFRPTYLQNLRYFLVYQVGYMYFRYLMWNFAGRQNDIPSTGEIEHGNFITGLPLVDDAMLGPQHLIPPAEGCRNPGRNVYFCVPFILGIAGIVLLCRSGKGGRRILAVSVMLFLMTGLAIVVYLNQTPGEPRERDYAFLGSYLAFSIWIGVGSAAIPLLLLRHRRPASLFVPALLVAAVISPAILATVNFDDHDRRGRRQPLAFSESLLSMRTPSIIFTQGDNFTFPLWFAQETMGIGKHHTVVDVSYLSTPQYVVNLLRQGKGSFPLTATEADIAYGALAFTRIAPDADTVPVPLIDALRELYASRVGAPMFRHSKVFLPGATLADTLFLNLRDFTSGGSLIPFRRLMLLDVLATNLQSDNPKPVLFNNRMRRDLYRPLLPAVRNDLYAAVYAPHLDADAFEAFSRSNTDSALTHLAASGLPEYAEPVVEDQIRRQRGLIVARALRYGGERGERLALKAAAIFPYHRIAPEPVAIGDSLFREGEEFVGFLTPRFAARGDSKSLRELLAICDDALARRLAWNRYYASLPEGRRGVVSDPTLRLIASTKRWQKLRADVKAALDSIPDSRLQDQQ